jgi:hypothetical protein
VELGDFGARKSVLKEWVGPGREGLALRGLELALKLGVRIVGRTRADDWTWEEGRLMVMRGEG